MIDLRDANQQLQAKPGEAVGEQALASAYFELRRWQDAVTAEKQAMAWMMKETDEAKRDEALRGAYVDLAWYDLFARDFNGAWDACEAGRKFPSDDLGLEINCAHSLLFLGRTKDAEEAYMKYRGKRVTPNAEKTWDQTVAGDFGDFKEEGLENADMGHILSMLGEEKK